MTIDDGNCLATGCDEDNDGYHLVGSKLVQYIHDDSQICKVIDKPIGYYRSSY